MDGFRIDLAASKTRVATRTSCLSSGFLATPSAWRLTKTPPRALSGRSMKVSAFGQFLRFICCIICFSCVLNVSDRAKDCLCGGFVEQFSVEFDNNVVYNFVIIY